MKMRAEEGSYSSQGVILEHSFQVWSRGKVDEFVVSLSHMGLRMQTRSLSTSCCHLCSDWKSIQILGRDILACRPAVGIRTPEQPNLGPPLFQLITYPSLAKVTSKTVYYFHLRPQEELREASEVEKDDLGSSDGYNFKRIHALKQEWVKAIMKFFFHTRPFAKSRFVNVTQSKTYLSQKLLVALNPLAGSGNALKVFRDTVVPIFRDAGTDYEVLVTEYPGHAYEVVKHENLARWKGVVCVSGDGLVHEVINALFDRVDWQDALSHLAVCSIPIGGTGAFGRSFVHLQGEHFEQGGVLSNILNAGRSHVCPMDLIFVQTKDGAQVGACNFGWGIINELRGAKSSKFQLLRSYRVHGLRNLLRISSFKLQSAVISYLPVKNEPKKNLKHVLVNLGSTPKSSSIRSDSSDKTCSTCSKDLQESSSGSSANQGDSSSDPLIANSTPSSRYTYTSLLAEGQLYFRSWQELDVRLQHHGPFPLLNNHSSLMKASLSTSSNTSGTLPNQKRPKPYFPAMPEMPKPLHQDLGWVTEVGDFVGVHLFNLPCLDKNRTVIPDGSPNDGKLTLLLIRAGIKRMDLYKFLNAIESDFTQPGSGLHVPEGVELLSVKGIRITPITMETSFHVDDKVVPGTVECIQAFVMPGVARTLIK